MVTKKEPSKAKKNKKPKTAVDKKTVSKTKVKPKATVLKKQPEIISANGTIIQPTSYTEVSRIHRSTLSTLKGSLVITSTNNGEGTTLLSHVMAIRSAEGGSKTLLIDLNMRNASLTTEMGFKRQPWHLSNRDLNESISDLIEPSADIPNLYFLPAPLDNLSVQFLKDINRARIFLENLEHEFDHIIVDTTPVGAMNRLNVDPVLLAAAARRTTMVFLAGVTPTDRAQRSIKLLRDAGANLEGIIVNDWKNPSTKDTILKMISPLRHINNGLHKWMRCRVINSDIAD